MNEAINPSSPKFSLKSMYIYHGINLIFKILIVRTLSFLIENLSIELYIDFWELLIYFTSVIPSLHLRCKSVPNPLFLRSAFVISSLQNNRIIGGIRDLHRTYMGGRRELIVRY